MASRTTIGAGVLLVASLLAVTGMHVERAPAADLTPVAPAVHEEEVPTPAAEILGLAKQMDFAEVRKQLPQVQPTDGQLADLLKPGQRQTAIALGKALFWDRQLGSDGQACASCHFHAGVPIPAHEDN
jgi:cytochrome c peroxidase